MQYQYIGMNYIHGDFLPTRPDFGSINAFTKEPLGYFPQSTLEEIKEAVICANKVLPMWSENKNKNDYFHRMNSSIFSKRQYIAQIISNETGKSIKDCRAEISNTLHLLQFFYKNSSKINKPKNVIGIITPSCHYFPIIVWSIVSIIFEGNTVIFNPGNLHPMIGQSIAELVQEIGLPPGVFNLIHGDTKVSTLLVNELEKVTYIG